MAVPKIQILLKKVDSLRVITDSMCESQQLLSEKIDSLYSESSTSRQMDSVSTLLNTISEKGIGYSDSASHIALPLIVALFAFAFPFLFTVISHINNKYKSEHITRMLSKEASYRWFMGGAIVCATFLFFASVFSISLYGEYYNQFKVVLNWLSTFVAGGYSAIIIWFVYTCISYNSPQKIQGRTDKLYNRDSKTLFKNTIKAERRIYNAEYFRIYRYIDLCKYAVSKQDYPLFISVLMTVSGMRHKTKRLEHLKFEFYEKVLDSYLFGKPNAMMEDALMMYWFMTFKKSEEPNLGIVFRMFQRIVSAIQQGRSSLFENYLLKSKFGYRYIPDLSIVSYIKGQDLEAQKIVDESRRTTWRELCVMHNIAIAHLFSLGYYEVIRIVQLGDNTGYDRLIPGTGIEVLKMFARCKEKQLPDGVFSYWACEQVVGKNTDPKMLEKYVAIMLLLASTERFDVLKPISPEHLKSIKDAKSDIIRYGNLWKAEATLKGLFPQIEDVDIKSLLDDYINWFEGDILSENATPNDVEKKCVIARIIDGLFYKGNTAQKKRKEPNEDIYTKELLESEKRKIEYGYLNLINGNRENVLNHLSGPDNEDKTESAVMGDYTYLMFKKYLVEVLDKDYNFNLLGEIRVYQSRYLYMLLTAIKNVRLKEEKVRGENLRGYLKNYLRDKGDEYVIIDIGNVPHLLLYVDKEDKERRRFDDLRVMKATYKTIDFNTSWYLNDLDELEEYKDTIVIIRKNDLPFIFSTSPDIGPTVVFEDVSDKKKGKAEVRVTVNPHLTIKYSKKAKVTRVKIVKKWG